MSYEIVKSIKIDKKNKKVYATGACNNVTPRTYMKWEVTMVSKIFELRGEEAAIKEILEAYYSGNFQPGNPNYYSKSLSLLDKNKYNWSNSDKYTSEELKEELYKNYLKMKNEPKGRFIISIPSERTYVRRFTARKAFTTNFKEDAKVFTKRSDAEEKVGRYKKGVLVIEETT